MKFNEKQTMMNGWIIFLFLGILAFIAYAEWPNIQAEFSNFVFWFTIAALIIFRFLILRTQYDADGIHIQFIPLIWKRTISWEEVQYAEVISFSFLDYGGFGYRTNFKGDVALICTGKNGLNLQLMSGSRLLIGTQHPEEIQKIILYYMNHDEKE